MVVVGRHAVLSIKGATMADGGHWKLRLENKFGYDEAVIKVSRSSLDFAAVIKVSPSSFDLEAVIMVAVSSVQPSLLTTVSYLLLA